jgi:hypothetical protein
MRAPNRFPPLKRGPPDLGNLPGVHFCVCSGGQISVRVSFPNTYTDPGEMRMA